MKTGKSNAAFHFRRGKLFGEGVDLSQIADQVGTPSYVYSRAALISNAVHLRRALENLDCQICFAVKANQNLAVLKTLAEQGIGFDVVSGGELYRVLRCGAGAKNVVFSGVGKRPDEIELALKCSVGVITVESSEEIDVIRRCLAARRKTASIALRVNLDVEINSHPYLRTGERHHKFGIDFEEIPALAAYLNRLEAVRLVGLACHIGSQVTSLKPFQAAFSKMAALYGDLRRAGIELSTIDVGGGLGVRYRRENPPDFSRYARLLERSFSGLGVKVILEPGRRLVCGAGVLLTRILYTKSIRGKQYYVVDAGMNDLMRPSLYQAWHDIQPLRQGRRPFRKVDVVGPICETGDFLARDRLLPHLKSGELLAVMQAAAYGFVQSSNYNARRRAPEVMIDGTDYSVVRKRETYADLIRGESLMLNP